MSKRPKQPTCNGVEDITDVPRNYNRDEYRADDRSEILREALMHQLRARFHKQRWSRVPRCPHDAGRLSRGATVLSEAIKKAEDLRTLGLHLPFAGTTPLSVDPCRAFLESR